MVKFKHEAGAEEEEIFSETARKLPVQLNRKQYENLFESFDYTKEATVDAAKGARGERTERDGMTKRTRTHSAMAERDGESWRRAGTMNHHQTCKADRIFTFKLNYFLRFVYD